MSLLDDRFLDVLETLVEALDRQSLTWALTGSTSFALQGVPVTPTDIDVQTTERGAYIVEDAFPSHVLEPVSFEESDDIRSHFGAIELDGVRVEVMGSVQKRRADGSWESPTDIPAHRQYVGVRGTRIPVLSLAYEADAYERLGRTERAALLATYAERPPSKSRRFD